MKLRGKVAIVTGAGRGIGKEIALAYAEEGAIPVLFARTSSEIETTAEEIRAHGEKALAIVGDVCLEKDVNELVRKVLKEYGKIDILVNNAGIAWGQAAQPLVKDMTLDDFMLVIKTNLVGTFLCCRAVLGPMIQQKSGVIINVLGMGATGSIGLPGYSAYNSSKAAIERFTTVLAQEVKPHNIRIIGLSPGGAYDTRSSRRSQLYSSIPHLAPRVVRPLAIYLASDDSQGTIGKSFRVPEWNKEHGFFVENVS